MACAFATTNRKPDIAAGAWRYLIAVQTVENVVFNCVPILSTAVRITIEMVPAMRAYSMAVVADSSRRKRATDTPMERSARFAQPGSSPAVMVFWYQFQQDDSERLAFMKWR